MKTPTYTLLDEIRYTIVKQCGKDCCLPLTTEDFGEVLCHHIHKRGMNFKKLAKHWKISKKMLAELLSDHVKRL